MSRFIYIVLIVFFFISCKTIDETKLIDVSVISDKKQFAERLNELVERYEIRNISGELFNYKSSNINKFQSDLLRYINFNVTSVNSKSSSADTIRVYENLYNAYRLIEVLYRDNKTDYNVELRQVINENIIAILKVGLVNEEKALKGIIKFKYNIEVVGSLNKRLTNLLKEGKDVQDNSVVTIVSQDFTVSEAVEGRGYLLKTGEAIGESTIYVEMDREYSPGSIVMEHLNLYKTGLYEEYPRFEVIVTDFKSLLIPVYSEYKHSVILSNYLKQAYNLLDDR